MFQTRHFRWAAAVASLLLAATPATSNPEVETEAAAADESAVEAETIASEPATPEPVPEADADLGAAVAFLEGESTDSASPAATNVGLRASAEKQSWVPTDVGRRWTYVFVSERSTAISGEEPHIEKLRGTRVDEIAGLAPEIGENVIRVQSRLVGRTADDATESSDEKTNFYRATPSSYQLVAEQSVDPTSGSAPLVRYEVPLALLELTAEPGQRWKVGVRSQGDLHTDLEGEVLGVQDVQTPHSLFENCLVIRLSGQISGVIEAYGERMEVPSGDYNVTQWYAPGMGLVLAKEELHQTLVREDGSSMDYSERNQFALRSAEPADTHVPAASE